MNVMFAKATIEQDSQPPQQQQQRRLTLLLPTVSATTTETTTTSARRNYFCLKRKRKLLRLQQFEGFKPQSWTAERENSAAERCSSERRVLEVRVRDSAAVAVHELRTTPTTTHTTHISSSAEGAAATKHTSAMTAKSRATAAAAVDDNGTVCILCRQHKVSCCLCCCCRLPSPAAVSGVADGEQQLEGPRCSCCYWCRAADRRKAMHPTATTTTTTDTRNSSCAAITAPTTATAAAAAATTSSHCCCLKVHKCKATILTAARSRTSPSASPSTRATTTTSTSLTTTTTPTTTTATHSARTAAAKLSKYESRTNYNQIMATATATATRSVKNAFFLNALKTFQMLFIFMQTHALLLLFKTRRRRPPPTPPVTQQSQQQPARQRGGSTLTRLSFRRCPSATARITTTTPISLTHHQQIQRKQQQSSASHRHHLQQKQQSYSALYVVLILLSFLSMTLPSTQAQTSVQAPSVTLKRNENVCKSMDIRNSATEFRHLRNCTVIEGFLLITLMNTNYQSEFNESFPLLTEVTEFILMYRVHYLRSLAQIFPNLSVIRGRVLFDGYALVIYSNPQMEELGLSNLIAISRGGVRIENNLSLCFVKTIDWSQIVTNTTDIIIEKNRPDIECPQCPGSPRHGGDDSATTDNDVVCTKRQGRRHCWSSKICQRFCPDRCRDNCVDEHTCCNESCLGGCASDNLNICNNCRGFTTNNTCIDACPREYYTYLDRRCITAETCTGIGSKYENNKQEQLIPYNGACLTRCPESYNKVNGTCQHCGDKCEKICPGGLIDSVERAKEYHGCTHITEYGLTISIARGGRHLMEDLEFGLSSIKVIETYLKVHRTYGMFSLQYFKNLKQISGNLLCEDRFALYVLENNDLESIWRPNQTVRIEDGRVFFHFNPKLCVSVINDLRPMLKHNATFDKNEVATDSNGSKGSCNTEYLNTTVVKTSHTMAIIEIVNPLIFEDDRTFIGYHYFYMEDNYGNATKHGNRPCDDNWTADEPTKETSHVYTGLKPFTQYAYYVKTMTISSEPRNAQSSIQYFKTKSAQPKNVRIISSYANSSSDIVVNWLPPTHVYGNLTKYKVRAVLAPKNLVTDSRNYCKDPLKEAAKIDQPTQQQATEKPVPNDCSRCSKDSKEGVYDEEMTDAIIHDSIDFENSVQNFVYVKNNARRTSVPSKSADMLPDIDGGGTQLRRRRRSDDPFDSFLMRHIAPLPEEPKNNNAMGTTVNPWLNDIGKNNSSNNATRMDSTGSYFVVVLDEVNATTTQFVFQKLKHFSVYEMSVEACRELEEGAAQKECSDVLPFYVRTMKRDDVDKVHNLQVKLENSNTSRSNIRLYWDAPESPNAAVVSYTISYEHQAQDAVEEKKCITQLDYQNLTNGYSLLGLPTGNYSIRVRANSLAGEGVYSNYVYIFIPPIQLSSTAVAIICISVIAFVSLSICFVIYLRKKILEPPLDLKIFPSINPYYVSMNQYIADEWEVPRERIIQLSALGQGSFGMVYEGILKGCNSSVEDMPCAIKTVNENATDRERMNFLNEASVMKQFDTYHVVRLLGVCSLGQPALVIMELMKNGDLKSYLRAHRPDEREDDMLRLMEMKVQPPPLSRIYQMAIEIADGMAYLAAKKFVHRDLAARNCMVAADLTVKIGDFGMTRDIYETDYYRKGTKGLLPVRWMPPESLRDGIYSTASDAFSYGVVLWEMATLASQPYQGLSNDQVLRYVIDGGVMERPENCPDKLYRLMQKCWHHRPTARPSFMDIIGTLLEHANSHFSEVSFYHSEDGQTSRNKEIQERLHQSVDEFKDNENDMDDVTTPLRVGEYNKYKMSMDNNSSVENQNDSPAIDDVHHPHSPYSLGSANINNSTPGGKNSCNLSQTSHNNPTISSAHSTSAGIVSGGGLTSRLHQPFHRQTHSRLPQLSHGDEATYVQPDYDARDITVEDEMRMACSVAKSSDTDERGYQVYDPSPNYTEHGPYDADNDDPPSRTASGGQNLLPKHRSRQRLLTTTPMSSSMPDDAISAAMSSALHPSSASAASSNASSNANSGAGGAVGKYPSLKKAVSETVQNVGSSLVPQRLRNMNRFFNHKRSGSNTSHKSSSSNPNSANSNSNLSHKGGSGGVISGRGRSDSGSNLGTIESGGSGSGGSYAPTAPRFFKTHVSDNPNYKPLNESANTSGISVVDGVIAARVHPQPINITSTTYKPRSGFSSSTQPNYQLLNESLNTSASPTRLSKTALKSPPDRSENVTSDVMKAPATTEHSPYELMQAPTTTPTLSSTDNPNYVMMNESHATAAQRNTFAPALQMANLSENPNYQVMGPAGAAVAGTKGGCGGDSLVMVSSAPRRVQSEDLFSMGNSHSSLSASTSTSNDQDDIEEDDEEMHSEGIKLECVPLSHSRSRSQSQGRSDDDVPAQTATTTAKNITQNPKSSSYQLKEKWLRQQQQHQKQTHPHAPPPPNGFIGREG